MVSDSTSDHRAVLRAWADRLACPVCGAGLALEEFGIVCAACGRIYPVEDGIAVLIAERAAPGR